MEKKRFQKRYFEKKRVISYSFLISILLHIVFGGAVWVAPHLFPPSSLNLKNKNRTTIDFVDAEKMLQDMKKLKALPQGQIVEQDEKQVNDEIPDNTKFLSRHNQKVVHETQAAKHGKFKNTDSTEGERKQLKTAGAPSAPPVDQPKDDVQKPVPDAKSTVKTAVDEAEIQPNEKTAPTAKTAEPLPDQATKTEKETSEMQDQDSAVAVHHKPLLKDLMPSFQPRFPKAAVEGQDVAEGGGSGASATDDSLKNVPTGMQTMLSTREFVYYTYYNRIKEKLRQYWEPKIKEKMEHIMRSGRTIAASTERITKVVIILDNKGTLVGVQVLGPSGVQDLDDAAVEAFRAAAPFPNPPKGIIDPDGTVKIRWDFVLEA